MSPPVIPSPFLLKAETNNKYLSCKPDAESEIHEILRFSEDNPDSPFIKFIIEMPNKELYATVPYVHIKCSFNGKYLTRVDQNNPLVVAAATDRNEDLKNCACTLFMFEPVGPFDDENNLFTRCRLRHLQSDLLTRPFIENGFELRLNEITPDPNEVDVLYNMSPPVIPSPFLLKAETNNKYLSCKPDAESEIHEILRFSEDNPDSPFIKFIIEMPNKELYATVPYVHIKCSFNGKYLTRVDQNNPLVVAAATDRNEDLKNCACTLFMFEPVGPFDDENNLFTRCRLRHLQSDLLTRPFIENGFELRLNEITPDPNEVDVYSVSRCDC